LRKPKKRHSEGIRKTIRPSTGFSTNDQLAKIQAIVLRHEKNGEAGMTTGAWARTTIVGLIFGAALGASAMAGPLEDGLAAYNRGDYTAALGAWLPLAERGDMDAQFNLGAMYQAGRGVRRDYPEAAKWYRKAAESGHAAAQFRLGDMYQQGLGLPQDDDEAFAWYHKAAEQGHAFAQYNLGLMYQRGQGAPQDFVQAYKWLYLAAARSEPGRAQANAARGRDRLTARMTATQVQEARRLAREWKLK
jgi:hypothetical protein